MRLDAEVLGFLQVVVLYGFIGVTSLFLMLTVIHRQRIEGVILEFPTGRLFGFPLRPILFVVVLTVLFIAGIFRDFAMSPVVWIGYVVGALFWGSATFVSTSVLVTEYGLVKSLTSRRGSISWGQVEDCFMRKSPGGHRFVFFYRDDEGRRRRFEVHVPQVYVEEFGEAVDDILDRRFRVRRRASAGRREFEDH